MPRSRSEAPGITSRRPRTQRGAWSPPTSTAGGHGWVDLLRTKGVRRRRLTPIHRSSAGWGAGSLLVASERLDGTLFEAAVVLVTEHSASGARGVILTRPAGGGSAAVLGAGGRRLSSREHYGGPVTGRPDAAHAVLAPTPSECFVGAQTAFARHVHSCRRRNNSVCWCYYRRLA